MTGSSDFTQGSILKKLSLFMLPVLGALILQAAYGAVDLLVVGQFGSTAGLSASFRGLGDSRSPLLFVLVACLVNIAGDLILVAGFGMDAAGAAIATVLAQGVSVAFALVMCKGDVLAGIFSPDAEVVQRGFEYLKGFAPETIVTAILFTMAGYFNGNNQTLWVMIQGLVQTLLVRLPLAYLMSIEPNASLTKIGWAARHRCKQIKKPFCYAEGLSLYSLTIWHLGRSSASCAARRTIFFSAARRMQRRAASRFPSSRPVNGSSSASASQGASSARASASRRFMPPE